jgi:hypothetical protein
MLRTPNVLRAFDPRIEMPTSRGPLPCLIEMPGLSVRMSPIENAGWFLNLSRSIVVTVWPATLRAGSLVEAPGWAGPFVGAADWAGPRAAGAGRTEAEGLVPTGAEGLVATRGAGGGLLATPRAG